MAEPTEGAPVSREPAFGTPGRPDAGVREVTRPARAHGCTGVELRRDPPEGLLTPASPAAERARVTALSRDAGVRAPWPAGYVRAADGPLTDTACLHAPAEPADPAAGAAGVRVLPDANFPGPEADVRGTATARRRSPGRRRRDRPARTSRPLSSSS
ncbi:hypothetical protein [Streptomyces sp. NPDC088812]|uniref:hypothetical protein n=1 Tax=Streptomyces sp. NPDC088812 TaxID=3365905 RepID=UPI00380D0BE3